jgi:hypothetical protein
MSSIPQTSNGSATRNAGAPSSEEIRQRAYEIFCARGRTPGDAERDWLEAEQELQRKLGQAKTLPAAKADSRTTTPTAKADSRATTPAVKADSPATTATPKAAAVVNASSTTKPQTKRAAEMKKRT